MNSLTHRFAKRKQGTQLRPLRSAAVDRMALGIGLTVRRTCEESRVKAGQGEKIPVTRAFEERYG